MNNFTNCFYCYYNNKIPSDLPCRECSQKYIDYFKPKEKKEQSYFNLITNLRKDNNGK